MRIKKQKRHRRVVRFFTACFGFREPYKVLCDGTFIHHLLVHDLAPADDVVSHLLGGRCRLYTTNCIFGELRSLGDSYTSALHTARELITARCVHERRVNAAACIEGTIAEENHEHFFVATQDADLRRKLSEKPGVPVIYGLKNSLFLEKPSSMQYEFVKCSEEKRLHLGELEAQRLHRKMLKQNSDMKVKASSFDGYNDAIYGESLESSGKIKRQRQNPRNIDKVQFKRNRAKGPNPLSCKRKKVKENSTMSKNAELENITKRKRSRKGRKSQNDSKHKNPST